MRPDGLRSNRFAQLHHREAARIPGDSNFRTLRGQYRRIYRRYSSEVFHDPELFLSLSSAPESRLPVLAPDWQ